MFVVEPIAKIIGGCSVRRRWVYLCFLAMICIAERPFAQVIDPVTAAQAPVSGAGHHYIGIGTETVNPADGSVSFDLPIQTPPGRGLSFPFAIRFNSSAPFFLSNGGSGSQFGWTTPIANGWPLPFDKNGWSYELPSYAAQAFVQNSHPALSGCGNPNGDACGGNQVDYCWSTQNYTFSGFDGLQHPLNIDNTWPDPNNTDTGPGVCNNGNGLYSGVPIDDGVIATLASPANSNTQPSLTVTDRTGTVYAFPQGPTITTNPAVVADGATPFGALAQTITDRNGNQIVLNGASVVSYGAALPAGSYTDTAGRAVVSWSGLGNPAGDQLTISGLPSNIVVKWTTTTVTFPQTSQYVSAAGGSTCSLGSAGGITLSVVSEIDLPNGQNYGFTYGDTWGQLTKITLPGGGYVRYAWGTYHSAVGTYQSWSLNAPSAGGTTYCYALVDAPAITDRYVSYDGQTEVLHQHFQYSAPTWIENPYTAPYWSSKKTTVTSTDLLTHQSTVTLYTYSSVGTSTGPNGRTWQAIQIPVEQQVVYQDGSGKALKTVNKTWLDRYSMIGEQTILDNGQGITSLRCVDGYDRVLALYEYDFQSAGSKPADPPCAQLPSGTTTLSGGLTLAAMGPLLRQTVTAYHNFGSTNILDEPDSVTVLDGVNNKVTQTSYLYDNGSTVAPDSGAELTGQVSPPGSRGNVTSVSRWLNTASSPVTTTYTYFTTGQIQSMTDPCGNVACLDMTGTGHITSYVYQDAYASGTGTPPKQTNTYLTQVTYPSTSVSHRESFSWGYNTGLQMSHTDENNQTTSYQYNDPLLRLKQVQGPPDSSNNNQQPTTTYNYQDWVAGDTVPAQSSVTKSELQNSVGTSITSTTLIDGMGHVVRTQVTSDSSGVDTVDTGYDGFGRVSSASNPYRSPSEPTYGVTTYTYDALDRKTGQVDSDGISTQNWNYSGSSVTYTDENTNQWQRTYDALGRLTQVLEPSGSSKSPTLKTIYTYDLLGDLKQVIQSGAGTGARGRWFSYDSLSRLIQAYNPESGWICYGSTSGGAANGSNCTSGYDANGNLGVKTDARGVSVSMTYDALNRLVAKNYSNDATGTPSMCFQYDTASNGIGRLATQWTQKGTCPASVPSSGILTKRAILSYDPMGRIWSEQQCVLANCATGATPYSLPYTYDLTGNVTSYQNGISSILFTNIYDAVGRLQTVSSSWADSTHPANLFSAQSATSSPCSPSLSPSPPYAAFGGLMNQHSGMASCSAEDTTIVCVRIANWIRVALCRRLHRDPQAQRSRDRSRANESELRTSVCSPVWERRRVDTVAHGLATRPQIASVVCII